MPSPETTFHSLFVSPSDKAVQALRLDDCRRWVEIWGEAGDLVIEVATRREKDQSAWARLLADEVLPFWLEAGQELWVRARTIDVWPGPRLANGEAQPIESEPSGWISMVVCRDAA